MQKTIQHQFERGLRWSLFGSVVYESVKALHSVMLFYSIDATLFGMAGSIFSSIYLAIRLADIGMTYSVSPFLAESIRSRGAFCRFIVWNTMVPYSMPIIGVALLTSWWYQAHFSPPYTYLFPVLIYLETMRMFMRTVLHNLFLNKEAVMFELVIFLGYIGYIWGYHALGYPITLNLIFIPHIIDSALSVVLFIYLLIRVYHILPHEVPGDESEKISSFRLYSTRFFHYLLRVNRNMFTSNFLTPFFALTYNLETAALFYCASSLSNGFYSMVRTMIALAGGGLFARVKYEPIEVKRTAFMLLAHKVLLIIMPLGIVVVSNYHYFISLKMVEQAALLTISSSLIYLMIILIESLFVLYEQLYLIEEMMHRLVLFKFLELAFFVGIVHVGLSHYYDITTMLIIILIMRIMTLAVIAIDAYSLWGIHLNTITMRQWYALFFTSLIISALLRIFFL